jgi:nucleotide-binding universal stress UspA family protein
MKRFTVLAAIDFSPSSQAVAREALELAALHPHSEVHLVTVQELSLELVPSPHDEVRLPNLRELADSSLRRFEEEGAPGSFEHVAVHIVVGDPAREIVALSAEIDADLIVVGSHSRRGLPRVLLGSVAEKVVRTAGCPVYVARAKAHAHALEAAEVEPLCTECLATRASSGGRELRCAHHAARHEFGTVSGQPG